MCGRSSIGRISINLQLLLLSLHALCTSPSVHYCFFHGGVCVMLLLRPLFPQMVSESAFNRERTTQTSNHGVEFKIFQASFSPHGLAEAERILFPSRSLACLFYNGSTSHHDNVVPRTKHRLILNITTTNMYQNGVKALLFSLLIHGSISSCQWNGHQSWSR
jgi:hypothetical protein